MVHVRPHAVLVVSIHSGHCWPENLRLLNVHPHRRSVFQSTPAIAGRRIWMPANASGLAKFQSTPAIAGRRIVSVPGACGLPSRFQSTPAIAGRRIFCHQAVLNGLACFNPLRPLLAGESPMASVVLVTPSFNPLRPLLAGESRRRLREGARFDGVSIHSGHCWPENP